MRFIEQDRAWLKDGGQVMEGGGLAATRWSGEPDTGRAAIQEIAYFLFQQQCLASVGSKDAGSNWSALRVDHATIAREQLSQQWW